MNDLSHQNKYWIVDFNSKKKLLCLNGNQGNIIGREFFVSNYPHFRNEAQFCSSNQLELLLLENEPNKIKIRLVIHLFKNLIYLII